MPSRGIYMSPPFFFIISRLGCHTRTFRRSSPVASCMGVLPDSNEGPALNMNDVVRAVWLEGEEWALGGFMPFVALTELWSRHSVAM